MKKTISIIALFSLIILFLTSCSSKEIEIEYGEKGECGETVIGGTNIVYKIPAGTYDVSLSAASTADVGFLTIRDSNTSNYNVIKEYKFDKEDNNKNVITIKEGQYVHITVNTIFRIFE